DRMVDCEPPHHGAVAIGVFPLKVGFTGGEYRLSRIEPGEPGSQPAAPAEKVRPVMGEKIRDRVPVGIWSRGIEHDRHDLQEMVLFDDDTGHATEMVGATGIEPVTPTVSR